MEYEYTLFDVFDRSQSNPVKRRFKKELQLGDEFTIDDVTYRVVLIERHAVVRMFKYKIPNTATQVVHKCPAKKEMLDALSKEDLLKISDPKGKKKSNRIKMRGGAVTQCPHCKVTFWKEKEERPEQVEVESLFHKSKKGVR